MKKKLCILLCFLLIIVSAGCSNDDNEIETVDYFGTPVPYTPVEENNLPEWLRELKNKKYMGDFLDRIFVGTLNDKTLYQIIRWVDSCICGSFYDKDGNYVYFEGDNMFIVNQMRNVKCIFFREYKSFLDQPAE